MASDVENRALLSPPQKKEASGQSDVDDQSGRLTRLADQRGLSHKEMACGLSALRGNAREPVVAFRAADHHTTGTCSHCRPL